MNDETLTSQTCHSFVERVEQQLQLLLTPLHNSPLYPAIRYAVLSPGKRFRPQLVYATAQALGKPLEPLDQAACAVELIHCYSLIHDDLPAMDDDDLRRGQATVHKAFDEATAILAGDAIQSLAFEALSQTELAGDIVVKMIKNLCQAIGPQGMAAGQLLDLKSENKEIPLESLKQIHHLKTAKLILAAIQLGAIGSEAPDTTQHHLIHFAEQLGLAFQIKDDLLDVIGNKEKIGKEPGQDQAHGKATYPRLQGVEASTRALNLHYQQAISALAAIPRDTSLLAFLAQDCIEREK